MPEISDSVEVVDLSNWPELVPNAQVLIKEFLLLDDSWVVLEGLGGNGVLPDFLNEELLNLPNCSPDGRGCVAVAKIDSTLAGTGQIRSYNLSICELKRMYVPSKFQSRGIGKLIVEFLKVKAVELGFDQMYLDVTTNRPGSILFYSSVGFRPCEALHEYRMPVVSMKMELI